MELEHSLLDFLCFVKCTVVLDGEELSPFLDLGCQILGFPAVSPREKKQKFQWIILDESKAFMGCSTGCLEDFKCQCSNGFNNRK
jgi:hypothetical protein